MEEIDLFDKLERLEKLFKEFEEREDKQSMRRVKKMIKIVNDAIKRENPDLVLDGDDELVCTCENGGEEWCDKHALVEIL